MGRLEWASGALLDLLSSSAWDTEDSLWLGTGGGGGSKLDSWELLLPEFGIKQPPLSLKLLRRGGSGGAIEDKANLFDALDEIGNGGFKVADEDVDRLEDVLGVIWELVRLTAAPLLKVEADAAFELTIVDCVPVDWMDGLCWGDEFLRLVICNDRCIFGKIITSNFYVSLNGYRVKAIGKVRVSNFLPLYRQSPTLPWFCYRLNVLM